MNINMFMELILKIINIATLMIVGFVLMQDKNDANLFESLQRVAADEQAFLKHIKFEGGQ